MIETERAGSGDAKAEVKYVLRVFVLVPFLTGAAVTFVLTLAVVAVAVGGYAALAR